MDYQHRLDLTKRVRTALRRTWELGNGEQQGELWGPLSLIETQLAWCLQQLRMADPITLPNGKEMNMSLAALREFSDSYGGGQEEYYQLIIHIQGDFERAIIAGG